MNNTFFNNADGHKCALEYRISRRNSGVSKLFLGNYKYSSEHIKYYRFHNSEDLSFEDYEIWWTFMSSPPLLRSTDDYCEKLYEQNRHFLLDEFKEIVANSIKLEKKRTIDHCGAHTLCPLKRFNGDVGGYIFSFL